MVVERLFVCLVDWLFARYKVQGCALTLCWTAFATLLRGPTSVSCCQAYQWTGSLFLLKEIFLLFIVHFPFAL